MVVCEFLLNVCPVIVDNGKLREGGCDFLISFGELQGVGSPSPSSFELDPEHEAEPSNSLYSKISFKINHCSYATHKL